VAVDNRLTAEQLAALVPGAPVTVEFARDFRPKYMPGTVLRLVGSRIVVCCRTDRGGKYVHEFDRRSGVRVGSGQQAELVAAHVLEPTSPEQRRQAARVDAAYRDWARHRDDVERLHNLREAIDECLSDRLKTGD
jgi:hypothetical protein